MFIEKIDIVGFRGISELSLKLNSDFSVLIGENRWGRSSLISALMLLSLDNKFYQFIESDFHHDQNDNRKDKIAIKIIYSESPLDDLDSEMYQLLLPVMYPSLQDGLHRMTYQMLAEKQHNKIISKHFLVDESGNRIDVGNEKTLISNLINLNPVMRLKNAINIEMLPAINQPFSEYYIDQLSEQLASHPAQFTKEELHQGLHAARSLLEYYLVDKNHHYYYKQITKRNSPRKEDWNSLKRMNRALGDLDNNYLRMPLLALLSAIIDAKGDYQLPKSSVPILILEEPESLLHPIILSLGFQLLKNFPTQKIITSNSSELVSLFPLDSIYHLIRLRGEIVAKYIEPDSLNASDNRRILFHILYRRSSALFARSWLLVEGETEVWLLRELAEQSGFHLNVEGVQLIEFAQCGLKPLIKYANKMGINWHVLTDGDLAGKKYADIVHSLYPKEHDIDDYLTVLPARDMENFLFKNGFSHIYKLAAYNTNQHIDMSMSKIIQKAIHKRSKPDLAIAVCDYVKSCGMNVIPSLLIKTFAKIVNMSKDRV